MFSKHRRIIWLLNHRTLMPYEVPLMQELGFEVFVPKVIPKDVGFRSGEVRYEFDTSLTIPKKALDTLNACNFYTEAWSDEVVTILNRYFGTAFFFHFGRQTEELLLKFSGQLVFRAFGYENIMTYCRALGISHGSRIHALIKWADKRFWFGIGYEELTEVEGSLLSKRAVYLPLGLPKSFYGHKDSWTGSTNRIMAVCPNLVSDPYYTEQYSRFRENFAHLPYVIAGTQDIPVDDPNVTGFLSDEQLTQLYQASAVFYYPSREQRHVHYSPVEAVIVGTPVVFYEDCLFARLYGRKVIGSVASPEEAQATVARIIGGDHAFTKDLIQDQKSVLHKFSHSYCKAVWEKSFAEMRIGERKDSVFTILLSKIKSSPPCLPPDLTVLEPPCRSELASPLQELNRSTMEEGIDFREEELPLFLQSVDGLTGHESWGRWSHGSIVSFSLKAPLKGSISMEIVGGAYEENVGKAVLVKIGKSTRSLRFSRPPWEPETKRLDFQLSKPARSIEITVPHPIAVVQSPGHLGIGIGFCQIKFITQEGAPKNAGFEARSS